MTTALDWTTASWSCRRSGASASTGAVRLRGPPRPSPSRRRRMGGMWPSRAAEAPIHPLTSTGQETAIDLGLESFATLASGKPIFIPSSYRKAEAYLRRCQRRVARRKKGGHRRRKAVALLAKAHLHIARQRRDFHHRSKPTNSSTPTMSSTMKTCGLPTWCGITIWPRASAMRAGDSFSPSLLSRLRAPGSECKR